MSVHTARSAFVILILTAGCGGQSTARDKQSSAMTTADTSPAAALAYWAGSKPADIAQYPVPTAVDSVVRVSEIPRIILDKPTGKLLGSARNRSVEIEVLASGNQPKIFGSQAPDGRTFVVVDTRWTNVHPKQRMDKAAMTAD